MRVSILVNSVDPTACHDYAVLWLDPAQHVWARQTSVGIALPPQGAIRDSENATLLVDAVVEAAALLTLGNFHVDARGQLTSIFGQATWFSLTRNASIDGLWRLQAIERSPVAPRAGRSATSRGGPQTLANITEQN